MTNDARAASVHNLDQLCVDDEADFRQLEAEAVGCTVAVDSG